MNNKDEFIRKMQYKLDKWNYDIDTMTAKADKVSGDATTEYNAQIVLLQTGQATARQKIKELKSAGAGIWENMRAETEAIWSDLGKTVETAKHHFR